MTKISMTENHPSPHPLPQGRRWGEGYFSYLFIQNWNPFGVWDLDWSDPLKK